MGFMGFLNENSPDGMFYPNYKLSLWFLYRHWPKNHTEDFQNDKYPRCYDNRSITLLLMCGWKGAVE